MVNTLCQLRRFDASFNSQAISDSGHDDIFASSSLQGKNAYFVYNDKLRTKSHSRRQRLMTVPEEDGEEEDGSDATAQQTYFERGLSIQSIVQKADAGDIKSSCSLSFAPSFKSVVIEDLFGAKSVTFSSWVSCKASPTSNLSPNIDRRESTNGVQPSRISSSDLLSSVTNFTLDDSCGSGDMALLNRLKSMLLTQISFN
uniref:Uncharacterized protein n=1 Tax=Polytomella parva TaxID=51329 RepID=A0A7S0V5U0_9CHLO|mmetsp:Transcript_31089/g.56486  ORF Transcript_31089/g.56486 Transcript_31089/m.56486 type:complete len:200 (+) Transcript_31089:47-646(+)